MPKISSYNKKSESANLSLNNQEFKEAAWLKDARKYLTVSKIAQTEAAQEQLKVLEKLAGWHRSSERTKWVIGEYLPSW